MDLRRVLLVLLVIAVVLSSSFFLLNYDDSVHYTRVGLTNTSSIEVPVTDESINTVVNGGIHLINDTKHDLIVMYFNSEEGNQVAAVELEYIRNDFAANSVQETLGNQTIWHNEENDTYMAFIGNYVTHDNILIICKDPEILAHMIASARYNYYNEETNTTETFNDANQSAVNTTNNSSATTTLDSTGTSQSSSSSNVPEGYYWSGQDADYIREYDDADGIHHIDRLHGNNESIDTQNDKHWTNGVEDTEAYHQDFN